MSENNRAEFDRRCAELRDASAAVDVFQRTATKGGFETVTIHVHTGDDEDCITRFSYPVGAIAEILRTSVKGVEAAEKIASVLELLEKGAAQDRGPRLTGGYRAGDLA